MWQEYSTETDCENGQNLSACPVGTSAPYPDISEKARAFIRAKNISRTGSERLSERILDKYGLLEELELLEALEGVWADFLHQQEQRRATKADRGR